MLGFDFMIDDNFKLYLIEVNTNPCLELSCPLLARIIPSMLDNSFRLAVDPLFPPPQHFSLKKGFVKDLCPENRYELIFDEHIDGPEIALKMSKRQSTQVKSPAKSSDCKMV